MVDGRFLPNPVDADLDHVPDTPCFDHGPAAVAVEDERHGNDGLEGVTLGATGRTDVGLARADPDAEVEHVLDHLSRDARAVVLDGNPAIVNHNRDGRRATGLLGGVDRIVNELLEDHQRPGSPLMADLGDQLLLGGEVEQATGAERGALESGPCRNGMARLAARWMVS